jgi:hypothetical protein
VATRTVALTAPAYVVAELLEGAAPSAAAALRKLDYPPVAAVTLSYPMSAILPDRLVSGSLPGAEPPNTPWFARYPRTSRGKCCTEERPTGSAVP